MRKFNVTVNGNTYSVEVEELDGAAVTASAPKEAPAPKAAAAPAPAPKAAPAPAAAAGGTPVKAPMPGKVLKLSVANGATVKSGQPILVLEAMKMENPINASADGVVTFAVSEGSDVETGTVLATIK